MVSLVRSVKCRSPARLDARWPRGHAARVTSLLERRKRLGVAVEATRKALGMATQADLAKTANVARGIVGSVERGERKVADKSLTKLEIALKLPIGSMQRYLDGRGSLPGAENVREEASRLGVESAPERYADLEDHLRATLKLLRERGLPEEAVMRAVEEVAEEYRREAESPEDDEGPDASGGRGRATG